MKPRNFTKRMVGDVRHEVQNKGEVSEIVLYDEIGAFGVNASMFRDMLKDAKGQTIELSINSPGGDVFDGIAIYNELKEHKGKVSVRVMGLAASAASIVAMAGDEVIIGEGAHLMIHKAWTMALGDAMELRKTADMLEGIDGSLVGIYHNRTGIKPDKLASMLEEETWLTADEAIELGFADAKSESFSAKAAFDVSLFRNVPGIFKRETEACLRDVGFSRTEAKSALVNGFDSIQRDVVSESEKGRDDQIAAKALAELRDLIKPTH